MMDADVHELKCWTEPFEAMLKGIKNFDLRKRDRDFKVGDVLHLREWNPPRGEPRGYTGRDLYVRVTYILNNGFGLPDGYCIMSTVKITPEFASFLLFGDML